MAVPCCTIYLNIHNGSFKLESFAVETEFAFTASFGKLKLITETDMKLRGLEMLLSDLQQFASRKNVETSEMEKMSAQQRNAFYKAHKQVSVSLLPSRILRIEPMQKCGGGFEGIAGGQILIDNSCSNEDFYVKLMGAFVQC